MAGPFEISDRMVGGADLARLELFQGIALDALEALAEHTVEVRVASNQAVLEEGAPADAFFVIRDGALAVFRDAVGFPVQLLARLYPGDFFGELGLFSGGRSMASVRAAEPSRLLRIDGEAFLGFVETRPELQLQLQMAAARRHSHNMASTLELGRRREVRVRCDRPVLAELADGRRLELMLENLSLGGACFSAVPDTWLPGEVVDLALVLADGRLDLRGEISWRRGERVGLSFVDRSPRHDMVVQMMIRLIHEARL